MKTWKQSTLIGIFAIITLALTIIACDDGKNDPLLCNCDPKDHLETGQSCDCGGEDCNCSEEPKVQSDTTRSLSFGTVEKPCSVTVKSDEKFTADEWNTLVDKVIAAIMRGYNKDMAGLTDVNKMGFEAEFASDNFYGVASIVLSSSATYNCEIKNAGDRIIYIKIAAIDAVDLQPAVWAMSDFDTYQN
jgi:hypothetical protein